LKFVILATASLLGLLLSCGNVNPTSKNLSSCKANGGKLYGLISTKIIQSDSSKIIALDCAELTKIQSYYEDDILLTSGRSQGQYVICLTNSKNKPCAHVIAQLIGSEPPSLSMTRIFGLDQPPSDTLNETIERLFLRPSTLLKKRIH
jgi:hypothetical protein